MNKVTFRLLFSIILLAAASTNISAQTPNIASQPIWGPTGYPHADYYYLPDIECYYSIPLHQFVYLSGGRWAYSSTLPSQYRSYDLYSGYKVVINKPRPFLNFDQDRILYQKYVNWKGAKQEAIRDSKDPQYKHKPMPAKGTENKGDFGP